MTHLVIFQQFYNKLFKMANREQSPNVIAAKKRSQSQKRFIKLEKKGFEIQATKLRSDYNNRYMLNQIKLKSHSNKKLLTQIQPQKIGNFLKPTKIITATAHKWAIYDFFSSKYIRGYRAKDFCQLGAFSKLLVFCAVNTIVQKNSLDTDRFQTIVTESVLKLHKGNSILKKDDIVSLKDLLYLMVIEESEVYESILAVNMGAFLQRKRQKQYYSVFDTKDKYMKEHLKIFYELVNSYCKLLKLENIRYIQADPELRKEKNKGSASDICVLTLQCLKIPLYMTILKVLTYNVTVKYINAEGNLVHRIQIITNKSVLNKFIPYCNVCRNWDENNFMDSNCSIFYQNQALQLRPIVVVLLGCYGPIDREKDIQQIVQWYLKNSKSQSKQAQPQNESQKPEKKREISAQKLPFIKVSSSNIVSQDPLSKKLKQKLKIDKNSAITNRYDDAIKFKVNPISKRVKTQLQ